MREFVFDVLCVLNVCREWDRVCRVSFVLSVFSVFMFELYFR